MRLDYAAFAFLLVVAGCGPSANSVAEKVDHAIKRQAVADPFELSFRVRQDALTFGELLQVEVEAIMPVGSTFSFDPVEKLFADKPFEYKINSTLKSPDIVLDDGRLAKRRTIAVDFFLPGEYEIGPLDMRANYTSRTI